MSLEFFDGSHTYLLDGVRIPCVSDLCRFLHREVYSGAPAWQMEAAAERGKCVHQATEELDRTGRAQIDSDYAPYLQAYAKFLQEHDVRWELIEEPMHHPEDLYAGTIDRYGSVDGMQTLADLKTTSTVQKVLCNASLNLYRRMLLARGKPVERLLIIHLRRDGSYRLVRFQEDESVPGALLTLQRALTPKRRKKQCPKK